MHKIIKGTLILTVPLFLCGINKVFSFKGVKIVHGSLCLFWTLWVIYYQVLASLEDVEVMRIFWKLGHTIDYLQLIFTSFLTGENFMKKFKAKLHIIEAYMQGAKYKPTIVKVNTVIVFVVLYKVFHIFVIMDPANAEFVMQPVLFGLFQVIVSCAEFECIWRLFLMIFVKTKIDQIHEILKELYPKEWSENYEMCPNVETRVNNLKEAYLALVELMGDIAKAIQISFVFRLALDMSKAFMTVYYFTQHGGGLMFSSFIFLMMFISTLALCPCVMLEMIQAKCFGIKVILIQQGLRPNIKSKEKRALHHFINVIVDQPIRLRIFGSYDVGVTFIINYFEFLATYSIFILQTAKYKFF